MAISIGVAPASGYVLCVCAMIYSLVALAATSFKKRMPLTTVGAADGDPPSVTVLKPLRGVQADTYSCLRSFCDQNHPEFQVVFGVSDAADPVVCIVDRLRREFPLRDLHLVVDRRLHGRNRKVSNLINMMSMARHEFLVIADSDVGVQPDYLRRVTAPLLDGGVGIVTCAYRGVQREGLWSLLGSLFINEWFMPSVCVASIGGSRSFAFGASIAIRRQVLARIGGFTAIANQLADDYRLGELTRRLGLRTVLSDVVVDTFVAERSFSELVHHELRWLRTIRAVRPLGYGFSFITFGFATALVGTSMTGGARAAVAMSAITLAARLVLHVSVSGFRGSALLWVPIRDALSLSLWAWGFATRQVRWGSDRYRVSRDGSFVPV